MGDWPTILDKSATLTLSNGQRVFVAAPLGLGNIGLEIAKYQAKSIRGTVCCALEGRQDKNISKMLQLMQMQAGMNAAKLNAQDLPKHVGESLRWGKLIALAVPAAAPVPLNAALGTAKALSGTLVDIPALSDIDMENPDVPKMSETERMMWVVVKCGEILDKTGKSEIAAAFKQLLEPQVIGMVVAGLIVWGASHFVGVGFILDIAAVVVMGLAVLKAFEVMWDIYKIISGTSTKYELERAAKMMADMVIDLGVETFLAIVLKGAAKSRFRAMPKGGAGSADEVVEMAPVKSRSAAKQKPSEDAPRKKKKTVTHDYDKLAAEATHNPDSKTVYLGRGNKDGIGYSDSAKAENATYFEPKDWDGLVKQMNKDPDEIFKVNQKFLEQQIEAGKTLKFTHPPDASSGGFYYQKELEFLDDLGYTFVKDGDMWKAVLGD